MTSTPPQLSPSGTNETFAETDPDSRLDTPRDRGSIDSGITTSSRSSLLSISERSSFSSHSQQSCLEPRRQTNQYTTSSHYLQPIPIEKDTSTKRPRLGHTSYLPLLASLAASAEAATIVPTRQIRQKRYWETIGIEEESLAENGRGKRGMRGPGSGSGSGSGTNQGHRVGLDQESRAQTQTPFTFSQEYRGLHRPYRIDTQPDREYTIPRPPPAYGRTNHPYPPRKLILNDQPSSNRSPNPNTNPAPDPIGRRMARALVAESPRPYEPLLVDIVDPHPRSMVEISTIPYE